MAAQRMQSKVINCVRAVESIVTQFCNDRCGNGALKPAGTQRSGSNLERFCADESLKLRQGRKDALRIRRSSTSSGTSRPRVSSGHSPLTTIALTSTPAPPPSRLPVYAI